MIDGTAIINPSAVVVNASAIPFASASLLISVPDMNPENTRIRPDTVPSSPTSGAAAITIFNKNNPRSSLFNSNSTYARSSSA